MLSPVTRADHTHFLRRCHRGALTSQTEPEPEPVLELEPEPEPVRRRTEAGRQCIYKRRADTPSPDGWSAPWPLGDRTPSLSLTLFYTHKHRSNRIFRPFIEFAATY